MEGTAGREAHRGSALYVWGYHAGGRIRREPERVPPHHFKATTGDISLRLSDIACGLQHTAAVASDGTLFTWGSNEFGQLGDGGEEDREEPQRVEALQDEFVTAVACGAHCTAALSHPRSLGVDGNSSGVSQLLVWGQNQGSNYPRLFRGAFLPNTVIMQVACGSAHVAALSADGLLQMWGYNEYGQLGRGFSCEGRQEARNVTAFVRFLDEDSELVKITQVACGEQHTAAIAEKGDVYTWGLGSMGQLGHRSLQSPHKEVLPRRVVSLEGVPICQISCGGAHTCAVSCSGALFLWGAGRDGQLGLGPNKKFSVGGASALDFPMQRVPVMLMPKGVARVTCGQAHVLAAMRDGRLLGWGYNSCGQAATGSTVYMWNPSPIDWCVGEVRQLAAGGGHSAVLTQACSLKELCELKLADSVTFASAVAVEDVALRTGSDSLARFCQQLRHDSDD